MALSTIAQLEALNPTLERMFEVFYAQELANRPDWLKSMTSEAPTKTRITRFPFPEAVLRTFMGDEGDAPQYRKLLARYVDIRIKKAMPEGIAISKLDLQDPFYSDMLMKQVQGLAILAAYMPLDRLINALVNGDTDAFYTMYDGQQLFSNTHTVGVTNAAFDNLFALPLTGDNLNTIKVALSQVPLGAGGEYINVSGSKWVLIVPTALERTARLILDNEYLFPTATSSVTTISSNVDRGSYELIVEERLTDPNDYYIVRVSRTINPFVHLRMAVPGADQLIPEIDPTSPGALNQDEFRWSWHSWMEVYPTHFWMMAKSVNA